MMEEKKLRKADFISALLLIAFSIWELTTTSKMPMKETYAGVNNVWYVSPALLPLFIGAMLLILGVVLLAFSIRKGGAADLIAGLRKGEKKGFAISDSMVSLLVIVMALASFVYLTIPRIDFYLNILNFLFFFICVFYFDDETFKRRYGLYYFAGVFVLFILTITGAFKAIQGLFSYTFDIVALLVFIAQLIYAGRNAKKLDIRKKFRTTWIITLVTPTILVPVFRYFLLVPMPHEGGIIKLMNLVYYAIR